MTSDLLHVIAGAAAFFGGVILISWGFERAARRVARTRRQP